jgi:hypothetical protein
MVQGSNLSGVKIFHAYPHWLRGTASLPYNGYRVSFLHVKQLGHGIDHPPPYDTKFKESVELYLYCPSGPSWSVLG